ncbi:hypothetical protein GCM10017559_07910 [Streptosporangium longisporum]|uniref:Uncharacterized protein n=1 Tax=Streptosporangium longisporum TaxID=46187 RepID=A0ABN3XT72_9ACTN
MQAQTTRALSPASQTRFQQLAAARLAEVLARGAEHALPAIPWTVTAVGCGLRADITPAAADPRGTHRAWVQALGLTPRRTMPGCLAASARMDGVQVTITTALTKESA